MVCSCLFSWLFFVSFVWCGDVLFLLLRYFVVFFGDRDLAVCDDYVV